MARTRDVNRCKVQHSQEGKPAPEPDQMMLLTSAEIMWMLQVQQANLLTAQGELMLFVG